MAGGQNTDILHHMNISYKSGAYLMIKKKSTEICSGSTQRTYSNRFTSRFYSNTEPFFENEEREDWLYFALKHTENGLRYVEDTNGNSSINLLTSLYRRLTIISLNANLAQLYSTKLFYQFMFHN